MPKPSIKTTFNAVNKMTKPMKSMKQAVGAFAAGAAIAIGAATLAFKKFISEASKIEDITASFVPMLGGFERANELVGMLNDTAATTPFQLKDIANAATQLLPAMNGDLEKIITTFRMLGDTAGGNVEKLNRISSVYSRVLLKNKLETGDLNILTERGIPIYKELSESMGISVQEMAKMATQGKITGDDLTQAFINMTSEGGVFFKGMEIASKTLTGKISTLKDNIDLTAASIGMQLLPVIKPLVDKAIKAAGAMRSWVEANKDLISQRVQDTVQKIKDVVRDVVGFLKKWGPLILEIAPIIFKIAIAIKAWSIAQGLLNLAQGASPLGAFVLAAGALILIMDTLEKKFGLGKKIVDEFGGGIGSEAFEMGRREKLRERQEARAAADPRRARLMGRNDNIVSSQTTITNQSQLDITMSGFPAGTTAKQTGAIPNMTLNTGFRQAGL